MPEVKKREDIELLYKEKRIFLKLTEHLQQDDPNVLLEALSKYYYYRDYYVDQYWRNRLEYKKVFSLVDAEKRTNLKSLEKQSVDLKGRPGFKVTEQMIKDEVCTDPRYVQLKVTEHETKFLINRLESGIELISWKLQMLCGPKPRLNRQLPNGLDPISERQQEEQA